VRGEAEGSSDVTRHDGLQGAIGGVVGVERGVSRSATCAEASAGAGEGFARAEPRVAGGGVRDSLAADGILLVIEREGRPCEASQVQVIQRGVSGGEFAAVEGEGDVTQAEGLGAGLAGAVKVLSRA
jgi:hypothetical protein